MSPCHGSLPDETVDPPGGAAPGARPARFAFVACTAPRVLEEAPQPAQVEVEGDAVRFDVRPSEIEAFLVRLA
jgi:hypothetical protein